MLFTARLLTLLAVISFLGACAPVAPTSPVARPADPPTESPLPPDALRASPRRIVGRVLAVDAVRGFAFVTLAAEPPPAALAAGAELLTRSADLHETGRLRAARYVRGRTLGGQILSGQPTLGDEVVFQTP